MIRISFCFSGRGLTTLYLILLFHFSICSNFSLNLDYYRMEEEVKFSGKNHYQEPFGNTDRFSLEDLYTLFFHTVSISNFPLIFFYFLLHHL